MLIGSLLLGIIHEIERKPLFCRNHIYIYEIVGYESPAPITMMNCQ